MLMLKTCGIVKLTILPAFRSSQALRQVSPSLVFRNIYHINNLMDGGSRNPEEDVPQKAQIPIQVNPETTEAILFESAVDMHDRLESEQKLYFFIAIGLLTAFNIVARIMLKQSKTKDSHRRG